MPYRKNRMVGENRKSNCRAKQSGEYVIGSHLRAIKTGPKRDKN